MDVIISDRRVSTRAAHNCWGCKADIPVGSKVRRIVHVENGPPYNVFWCDPCDTFMDDEYPYDADGWGYGELAQMEGYPTGG